MTFKTLICAYCGKEFTRKKVNKNRTNYFCSRECSLKYRINVKPTRGISSKVNNCTCTYCGKEFHKTPSSIREHNFCSRKCQNTYQAHKLRDKAREDLNCTCIYCGKKFHRKQSHVAEKNFCGSGCLQKYNEEKNFIKKCIVCGKEFKVTSYKKDTARFCSVDCHNQYQRRFFKEVTCDYCGKKFISKKSRNKENKTGLRFCSNKCIGRYFRGEKSPTYKGNRGTLNILRTFYELNQRSRCFSKYKGVCQICGQKAEHVHHIIPLNKIISNFILENKIDVKQIGRYELANRIIKENKDYLDENNLIAMCEECHKKQHRSKGKTMNITNIEYGMSDNSYNIFFSGCSGNPKCEGCCNPENWSFDKGENWLKYIDKIKRDLTNQKDLIKRIIIVGGEPLDQDLIALEQFIDTIKGFSIPIYLFTRYGLKDVPNFIKSKCDFIKCGEYKPSLTCSDNIQYGIKLATSNQKIYKKGEDY